jgi:hypothetical protein
VFDVEASDCWDSEHVAAFANLSPADIQRFERDVRVIADYAQQRTLQRAVLHRIQERLDEQAQVPADDGADLDQADLDESGDEDGDEG